MADPFDFRSGVTTPLLPGSRTPRDGGVTVEGVPIPGSLTRAPRTTIYDAPAIIDPTEPAPFAGSPLNTLYGIDSESYLTDDQRKLARMIQGKFDASVNRRDRELARYGAPQLSSFAEDEALARAMSLARGLNFKEPVPTPDPYGMARPTSSIPRSPVTRVPTPPPPPELKDPNNFAKWQQIVSGIISALPLLFGKEAMASFMKTGAIPLVQKAWKSAFGTDITPAQAASAASNGGWDILPNPGLGAGGFDNPLGGDVLGTGGFDNPFGGDVLGTPGGGGYDFGFNLEPDLGSTFTTPFVEGGFTSSPDFWWEVPGF